MAGDGTKNGSEPSGTELERFEELAKKLVSVPKSKIDEARKTGKVHARRSAKT